MKKIFQNNKGFVQLIVAVLVVVVGVVGFYLYSSGKLPTTQTTSSPSTVSKQTQPAPVVPQENPLTKNWKTYFSNQGNFSFKYPNNLEKLIALHGKVPPIFYISARTKEEIVKEYEGYKKSGCPGPCASLVETEGLLQKQFDLLSRLSEFESQNCSLSEKYKEAIAEDFILFGGGMENRGQVEGVNLYNGICGLKTIQFNGYDVALSNFYYTLSFINKDKIVHISFSLFPMDGVFDEVDKLFLSFGYKLDSSGRMGNDISVRNEEQYFENFKLSDKVPKSVIDTYDQMISTLRFL